MSDVQMNVTSVSTKDLPPVLAMIQKAATEACESGVDFITFCAALMETQALILTTQAAPGTAIIPAMQLVNMFLDRIKTHSESVSSVPDVANQVSKELEKIVAEAAAQTKH